MITEVKKIARGQRGIAGIWIDVKNANGTLYASICKFDEPSMYGIAGGKISKLQICSASNGKPNWNDLLYSYDRGLDITSHDKEVMDFYREIVAKYNK